MIYAERLAQKIFRILPDLDSHGPADGLLDVAYKQALQDLGYASANYNFRYDEDFTSDFVSEYARLQRLASTN